MEIYKYNLIKFLNHLFLIIVMKLQIFCANNNIYFASNNVTNNYINWFNKEFKGNIHSTYYKFKI